MLYFGVDIKLDGDSMMLKKRFKRIILPIATCCSVFIMSATPSFADSVTMYEDVISLNGTTSSTPYGFVDNSTTYMPLYYVIQLLNSIGISNSWNGSSGVWSLTNNSASNVTPLNQVKNEQQIDINGVFYAGMQSLIATDPSSDVKTTYVPIYYIIQVLNLLNINNSWNGIERIWSITTQNPTNGNNSTNTTTSNYGNSNNGINSNNGTNSNDGVQNVQNLIDTAQNQANTVIDDDSALNSDYNNIVDDTNTIKSDYQGTLNDFNTMSNDIQSLNTDAQNGYDINSDAQSVYSDSQGIVSDSQSSLSDVKLINQDLQTIKKDAAQLQNDNNAFNNTNAQLPSEDQITLNPTTQAWYKNYVSNLTNEVQYGNSILSQQQQIVDESLQDAQNTEKFASTYQPSEYSYSYNYDPSSNYSNSDNSNPLVGAIDIIGSIAQGSWNIFNTLIGN